MRGLMVPILLLILLPPNCFAQAGNLDSTFGSYGITHSYDIQYYPVYINPIELPNGKILVIADSNGSSAFDFPVFRLLSNGSTDMTFGYDGGSAVSQISNVVTNGTLTGASIQPDGKILLAGGEFFIVRLNADGSVDTSFGMGGVADLSGFFVTPGLAGSVIVMNDGTIIFSAYMYNSISMNNSDAIIRVLQNGQIDTSFGNNGLLWLNLSGLFTNAGSGTAGAQLMKQSDGKIIVWGNVNGGALGMQRLNTDCSTDSSFGINGITSIRVGDPSLYSDNFNSIALGPDGKIVVGGNLEVWAHGFFADEQCIVRFDNNGSPDASFGAAGVVMSPIYPSTDNNVMAGVAVQQDNKIVFAADDEGWRTHLIRFNISGEVDSTFGTNGTIVAPPNISSTYLTGIAIQNDGKILVTAQGDSAGGPPETVILRFLSGLNLGIINLQSENESAFIYPNPIHNSATLEYSLINSSQLSIFLYDMSGKLVKTFINAEERSAGAHKEDLIFDLLSTGNYLLVISNCGLHMSVRILKD